MSEKSNLKSKSRFSRLILPILGAVFLICFTSFLFILQMNKMIERHTLNTINELAEHDMRSITQFVVAKWRNLRYIANRLSIYNCNTLHDAQERLNLERSTSDFHTIFLIDEDNVIYSDRYAIYENDELNMLERLDWQGRNMIVRRFDFVMTIENQKEMLLYAVKLDDYKIDDKKITTIVGITDINSIQEDLIIYYFRNGDKFRGYSSVVNTSGDYIVNIKKTSSLNQQQNLFSLLGAGVMKDGWTEDKVIEKMNSYEIFRFDYVDADGVKKLLFFIPIQHTTWYFISMVERKVFTEQLGSFIIISISMIVAVLAISAIMILMFAKSSREAMLARAESKARSEFLSNMSHEIRTPLNGIIGLLYLLRSRIRDNDPKQMEDLIGKADDSAKYLLSLVSDILDMSKLHAQKLKLNLEPFSLSEMIMSVADMQRSNAERNGVFLKLDAKIYTPNVIADETRLKQVLMNVVGNSVKFTPKGGMIKINVTQDKIINGYVDTTIVCSDTGIGMSEEFQKTIWDSFTQEHNKLSNGVRGTGLGMSITKGIIDAMGGTITVQSKLNEGTSFTIKLNLPVTEEAAQNNIQVSNEKESLALKSGHGIKVLVAEDNELNSEILAEILQGKGFEVDVASDGKIALDKFSSSSPNEYKVILMDMQMPVMDGCEASRQIRETNHPDAKTIKIFACTANVFQEDKDRALASGMDDFLIKPIDVDVLLEKLRAGL